MKTIEVRIIVKNSGKLMVDSLVDMPAGEYNAVLVVEDQVVRHTQTSVQNAQAIFRRYIPTARRLSEELIQERREEALRE